ncbi:RNA polymerase sigma factor [Planctomycetota bacterium]
MNDKPEKQSRAGFSKGDADVWREFLERQLPQIYAMFIKRWWNPSLAEEMVQKTVFDAVRGLSSYDPQKASPQQWIYGIARNNIRLEIRKRAGRPSVNGDISTYLEAMDKSELPDEVLERKETSQLVCKALNRLDAKQQQVLRGKYIESLSARQIAKEMNLTEKAVHSLLYRARNALQLELKLEALI